MRTTSRLVKAVSVATAAAALASLAVITSTASALPPNTPPTPGQVLNPSSGTATGTTYTLTLTNPDNKCPGDGLAGYRWSTFLVPDSVDAGTLTWNASGPIGHQPLYSSTGAAQVARTPGIGDGLITGTPAAWSFANNALVGVPNGVYKIGFACTLNSGGVTNTERYWQTRITVSGSGEGNFTWVRGTAPAAPTLASPLTVDNQTINGSFSETAADPAITARTVTATPQGGGTTVTKSVAAAGAFTLTGADGVVNGKVYDVKVTVTNSIGSTDSNTVTSPLVAPPTIAAPSVSTVDGVGKVTVNWIPATAPGGATLVNHVVSCNANTGFTGAACPGSPFTVAAGTNTLDVTLDPGTYFFRVQATYAAPFIGAQSASAAGTANASQVLVQDITVVRPAGALVLTQKCGVYGSAAEYNDPQMGILPAIPATTGADPTGGTRSGDGLTQTAGSYPWSAGGLSTLPSGTGPSDPNRTDGKPADVNGPAYDGYPYPVNNSTSVPNAVYDASTNCLIDLGTARLITNGPNAGQYFATTGRINQITVINTQDIDGGWTLNGKMSNFTTTAGAGDSFSGNLLGWNPEVTWSSLANLDGYLMEVGAGNVRQPVATSSTAGLGPNGAVNNATQGDGTKGTRANSLAKASLNKSLGMAVIDARLRLLIPVTANAGTYTGTLTFTTV